MWKTGSSLKRTNYIDDGTRAIKGDLTLLISQRKKWLCVGISSHHVVFNRKKLLSNELPWILIKNLFFKDTLADDPWLKWQNGGRHILLCRSCWYNIAKASQRLQISPNNNQSKWSCRKMMKFLFYYDDAQIVSWGLVLKIRQVSFSMLPKKDDKSII